MAILDCFMFNDEFDILELRMKILYPHVDKFVIVQSKYTHSGKDRDIVNINTRWPQYVDKISTYVVGKPQIYDKKNERWQLENYHRNQISLGLNNLNNGDAVLISDVDEIPDLMNWNHSEGVFVQQHSYYKFDLIDPRPWNGTVCIAGWRFNSPYGKMTPQDCRNFRDLLKPCGTGWHFGWIGSIEKAKKKIEDFAHFELDNSEMKEKKLIKCYEEGLHPSDGTPLNDKSDYFPKECKDYPQHWKFS